ncbi:hypothetical protein ACXR2U_22200 [Jatrophihabitans sp. YIM 134969]
MAGFDVDLEALQAWSAMVERQRGYLEQAGDQRASQIPDGDFGVIMDLISGAYTDLLPRVDDVLNRAATNMGVDATALSASAVDYRDRDVKTGDRFAGLEGGRR